LQSIEGEQILFKKIQNQNVTMFNPIFKKWGGRGLQSQSLPGCATARVHV